jgi:hypothetical protein
MKLASLVAGQCDRFTILDDDSIAWNSVSLADELMKVGYTENIGDSSDTSGACIFNRLFAISSGSDVCLLSVCKHMCLLLLSLKTSCHQAFADTKYAVRDQDGAPLIDIVIPSLLKDKDRSGLLP